MAHPNHDPKSSTHAMRVRDELRVFVAHERRRARTLTPEELASRTRSSAALLHMAVLFGVPLFLGPLWTRRDPVQLHHAKVSALAFVLFYGGALLALTSHWAWVIVAMLAYVPALVGVWSATRDRPIGWLGLGPVAERLLPLSPRSAPAPPPQLEPATLPPLLLDAPRRRAAAPPSADGDVDGQP